MTATAVAPDVHQDVDDLIAAVYGDEMMLKTTASPSASACVATPCSRRSRRAS